MAVEMCLAAWNSVSPRRCGVFATGSGREPELHTNSHTPPPFQSIHHPNSFVLPTHASRKTRYQKSFPNVNWDAFLFISIGGRPFQRIDIPDVFRTRFPTPFPSVDWPISSLVVLFQLDYFFSPKVVCKACFNAIWIESKVLVGYNKKRCTTRKKKVGKNKAGWQSDPLRNGCICKK